MAGDNQVALEVLIQIREEIAGLNRARAGLQGATKDAETLGSVLKNGLGIGSGVALAAGALQVLKSTIQSTAGEAVRFAGQVKDMSTALGLSASAYQVLSLEFKAAGADLGRMTQAISEQTRSLAEARDTSSSAAKAYQQLGLDAAKIEALPVEERMIAVARATRGAADQTTAFAAASQILGGRGLPLLLAALEKLGTDGVANVARLYEKQGLLFSDDTIERLDRAEKTWGRFWHSIVIGSGEALSAMNQIADAAKKDFFGTTLDLLKAGLPGGNLGDIALRLARDSPSPVVKKGKPAGTPGATFDSTAAKAAADAADALKKAGEATRESVLTAYEKYEQAIAKLRAQHKGGAIDAVVLARAEAQVRDELHKALAPTNAVNEALQRQGEAIRESVLTPLERWAEKLAELTELNNTVINGTKALSDVDFNRAMKVADEDLRKATEKTEPTPAPFENWADTAHLVGRSIESMSYEISDAVAGLQSWGDAWRGLGQIALRTLSDIIAKTLIMQAINAALGIFGFGVSDGVISKVPAVKAAGGGQFVTSGPTNFTVGDNPGGIELVSVMPISGIGQTTVNGNRLAMAGGGSALVGGLSPRPISVTQVFNVATGVADTVRAEIFQMMPAFRELAVNATQEAIARGDA